MFLINYDDRGYLTNLPLNGNLTVNISPFSIEYTVYIKDKILKISPFKSIVESEKITCKGYSTKSEPLSSIDGLLMHHHGLIKVEVIRGIIYLQNKPLEEYFYDPEHCSSSLPPFSIPPNII